MGSSVKDLLAAANAAVPRVASADARALIGRGNVLIVDVRERHEVEASGRIRGAVHVSRGMLEFRADPDSQHHDPAFDKSKTIVLYCASGVRSALAGKVLKDFGYGDVYNLGGFEELAGAGLDVERE